MRSRHSKRTPLCAFRTLLTEQTFTFTRSPTILPKPLPSAPGRPLETSRTLKRLLLLRQCQLFRSLAPSPTKERLATTSADLEMTSQTPRPGEAVTRGPRATFTSLVSLNRQGPSWQGHSRLPDDPVLLGAEHDQ
jgi:hypothetical protein